MATHIISGKNNLNANFKNSKVHSIPFYIHADCDTKVEKYFDTYTKTQEDGTLTNSFRGFPLKGKEVKLPEGYEGMVLQETIRSSREKDERKFYMVNKFDSITYWNWDKAPSKNDVLSQALDWIDIAEALHSPIIEE